MLRHWRVLHPTPRQRRKLHNWLVFMAAECPEAGLAPCGYGSGPTCECKAIARPVITTTTGFGPNMPRRPSN